MFKRIPVQKFYKRDLFYKLGGISFALLWGLTLALTAKRETLSYRIIQQKKGEGSHTNNFLIKKNK